MKELLTIEKMLNCRLVAIESMLQSKALQQSILSSAINIAYCLSHGGKVITAGNGGSASQSQHFVAELMGKFHKERCTYSAISLNSDTSLLTCIGDDYGFERIFSRQILGIAKPNLGRLCKMYLRIWEKTKTSIFLHQLQQNIYIKFKNYGRKKEQWH